MRKASQTQNMKDNEKKIRRLLEGSKLTKDIFLINLLPKVMHEAIEDALDIHKNQNHTLHLEIGDSYGWVLAKDGKNIAMEVFGEHGAVKGQYLDGESRVASAVSSELVKMASSSGAGWHACLMAGMSTLNGEFDYFSTRFEIDVLEMTSDMVKTEVSKSLRRLLDGKRK